MSVKYQIHACVYIVHYTLESSVYRAALLSRCELVILAGLITRDKQLRAPDRTQNLLGLKLSRITGAWIKTTLGYLQSNRWKLTTLDN
ncbi:hypothetical protein CDAR_263831 [Caerostris darwini]|uniref:Uncharacterized protein n=1 Tax=Caerostris darwini TaxID=1538125 RepID=A0AAV4RDE3_9ARAC|nr:hypothetical protein CDAR_263831 [Caerostris darwini]